MDRKEAIKRLKELRSGNWCVFEDPNEIDITNEALDMAIDALSANCTTEKPNDIVEQKNDVVAEPTDLISRAELLDRIKAINSIPWGDDHGNAVKLVWSTEEVKRLIEKAPSAGRPSGEWILCSEKLPEDGQGVIICTDDKRFKNHPVGTCTYEHGRFHTNFHDDISMIAWMPLPKPYCPNCGAKMGGDAR